MAEKVITWKKPVVTATRKIIMTTSEQLSSAGISSHEEADTMMMIHTLEIVQTNKENAVDFFYTRHRLVGANPS